MQDEKDNRENFSEDRPEAEGDRVRTCREHFSHERRRQVERLRARRRRANYSEERRQAERDRARKNRQRQREREIQRQRERQQNNDILTEAENYFLSQPVLSNSIQAICLAFVTLRGPLPRL